MILLDTDHVTILLCSGDSRHQRLTTALQRRWDEGVGTTIVTVEEQMRGWLAKIHRAKAPEAEIEPYARLAGLFSFFARWRIELFDQFSIIQFQKLTEQRIRIGTQDLKIASIALSNNSLFLSANLKDFEKVPGLRVENWLE